MMLYIPTELMIRKPAKASPTSTAETLYNPSEALLRAVRGAFNKKKRKPSVWFDSPRSGNC